VANTLELSRHLATARLRDSRGTGALDVFAVAASAVTSWLAFVVASGTWMFVQRRDNPPELLLGPGGDPAVATSVATAYVVLAAFACALLVLPILGLGGAAARLGARGRARRLASLRLIGMTSREVVTMSVVESVLQAAVGLVIGVGLWLASTPLLGMLSFQGRHIGFTELLMPWWLWLAVAVVVLTLAALSTVIGLARVRISPLGVARQASNPALRAWRVLAFVLGLGALLMLGQVFLLDISVFVIGLVFGGMVLFAMAMTNLFAPWLLQLIARFGVLTGSAARLIAMRRIIADPRSAWRNVSSLGLIGFIVGVVSTLPLGAIDDMNPEELVIIYDIRTGAWLTLGIAVLVGAAATALAQSSDVVDRGDELVALDRMGVPPALDAAARRHQVLMPLVLTLGTSMALGGLVALPLMAQLDSLFAVTSSTAIVLAACLIAPVTLTLAAAEATRPLRRRAIGTLTRRND